MFGAPMGGGAEGIRFCSGGARGAHRKGAPSAGHAGIAFRGAFDDRPRSGDRLLFLAFWSRSLPIVRNKLEDMGIDAMQFYETLKAYRHAEGMRGGHIPPCGCAAQDMEEGQVDFKKLRECKANRALNKVMQLASKTTMSIQELQYQQEVAMLEEIHK